MFIRNSGALRALPCPLVAGSPSYAVPSITTHNPPFRTKRNPARPSSIGCDNRGRMGAQRYPGAPFDSLAFDELVTRVAPGQDRTALVVEDEVTPVSARHQHGVACPSLIQNNRHP